MYRLWELDHKEGWAPKKWCFWIVLEKTLESLLDSKEIKPVNPKETQPWIFIGRTDAEVEAPLLGLTLLRCEEPTHWKSPWCWERLRAGGEGDNRGWNGWMLSPTQWTWVWVNSKSLWWTVRPGVLQSMGLQRLKNDWATEPNWTELNHTACKCHCGYCCHNLLYPNPVFLHQHLSGL